MCVCVHFISSVKWHMIDNLWFPILVRVIIMHARVKSVQKICGLVDLILSVLMYISKHTQHYLIDFCLALTFHNVWLVDKVEAIKWALIKWGEVYIVIRMTCIIHYYIVRYHTLKPNSDLSLQFFFAYV